MNKEEKIIQLVTAGIKSIQVINEYAPGKKYETDIGLYYQEWLDRINPESTKEVIELRDISGSPSDEQEPIQTEHLDLQFAVAVKKGSTTAAYLRQVKADIYRMIGANIDNWRAAVDASLYPQRGDWEKDIQHEKEIVGILLLTITISFEQEQWLTNEPDYT